MEQKMEPEKKRTVKIRIPNNALLVMVGASGSGKTTIAQKHFPGCVVASDTCRRMLAGDPTMTSDVLQKYSEGAFQLFYAWIRARLRHGLLTVADSTALRPEYRNELFTIAQEEHVKVVYLFVDAPFDKCVLNNAARPEHDRVPEAVIKRHFSAVNRSRGWLRNADNVIRIRPGDEIVVDIVEPIQGVDAPALDVIGDVHGCMDELIELIEKLGYKLTFEPASKEPPVEGVYGGGVEKLYRHPDGRKLAFVGDLIDRGPEPYKVLDFVRRHVQAGLAELVLSNHERKLRNWLSGRNVNIKPAFQATIDSIPAGVDKRELKGFLYSLRPYRVWTSPKGEQWVVAHAAFDPKFLGKVDSKIEEYCAYGPVESVDPVTHIPTRIDWWEHYRNGPKVVYGHIITDDGQPRVANGTYGIDTGCVHGGSLTALRLPEEEFVQVKARRKYAEDAFSASAEKKASEVPGTANLDILSSKRVTVRDHELKNTDVFLRDRGLMEAIDALSTRTIRPDKLVWLSPTMSPGPVSDDPSMMEDPVVAAKWMFEHAPEGTRLSAQVKHMGSRGTWLCERKGGRWQISCWTRNGYEMFDEPRRAQVYELMQRPLDAIAEGVASDVLLLDSEVMPFNQHGAEWLERVFMQTAAAGHVSRFAMARAVRQAVLNGAELAPLRDSLLSKMENLKSFGEAANRFCWPVGSAGDVRVGIFDMLYPVPPMGHHDLVGAVSKAVKAWPVVRPTESRLVENTPESLQALMDWFLQLTAKEGVEGMVLKYDDRDLWSASKFPQQALKVRGKDYLRLVYGPQYLEPDILAALRKERRTETKMRMAYQQNILGREALRRNFKEGRPFEEWHECVLSIMAADKATVDPRL